MLALLQSNGGSLPAPVFPPYDFGVWWDLAGRWYTPIWTTAIVAALAARWAASRLVPKKTAEKRRRRLTRETITLSIAAFCSLSVVLFAGFVTKITHASVHGFFFTVGVAFWATAVFVPAFALFAAAWRKDGILAGLAAAPLALSAYMLFVEPNLVGAIRETIVVPTLPKGCEIKIAHFSDIQTIEMSGREERALELANEFDPDLVILTGDMTASGQHPAVVTRLADWLTRLKTKNGRYLVNGDSDFDFDELAPHLPAATYLKDSGLDLRVNGARLWLGGVDNKRRPPDPQLCMAGAPSGATRLLLTHNPDRFIAAGEWHAEVGLAGHTHGGQVHVPGIGPIVTFTVLGAPYAEGVFPKERLDPSLPWKVDAASVCPGIGMEGCFAPRVRLLCPPRVVLLTLRG